MEMDRTTLTKKRKKIAELQMNGGLTVEEKQGDP